MKYTDFGTLADGKAKRVKWMRQFQLAKMRMDKAAKAGKEVSQKDIDLVYSSIGYSN